MRRPKSIIAYTTVLAFVLTACAVKIEPTDLSAVTVDNDRIVVEKALGKPDQVIETQGLTVTSYSYDKGISEAPWLSMDKIRASRNHTYASTMLGLILGPILVPITHAAKTSEARAKQRGKLAAIFDADNKLVFAGSLEEPDATSEKLTSLATTYTSAQSDGADALFDLSEVALIPSQKQTFIEKAANSGSAEAQYRVANSATNDADKIGWFRKAAAQDHIRAQTDLGMLLIYGPSELVDRTEAKVWLTKAAAAGNSKAQTELSMLSEFETLLARAERGDPEAQYALGNAYDNSEAGKRNLPEAVNWWLKAAEAGHAPSQTEIGKRYLDGRGSEKDREKAKLWLARAAEAGDAAAIEALKKLDLDEGRASKLRVTAQQGDTDSQRQLANAYRDGAGIERNFAEAIRWYELAAKSGDGDSQYALGALFEFEDDIETDHKAALKWYIIAERTVSVASLRRVDLSNRMSPDQIAEAERLAREWLEAHPQ